MWRLFVSALTSAAVGLVGCSQHRSQPISPAGSTSGGGGSSSLPATPFAPPESPRKSAYINYQVPPPKFAAAVAWLQGVDIDGNPVPCTVEVASLRLHAVLANGHDLVLQNDDFDVRTAAMAYYARYSRFPWFSRQHGPMSFSVSGGVLSFSPHLDAASVWHLWGTQRAWIPPGTVRLWVEAEVRITGAAGVQIGGDGWTNLTDDYAGSGVNNVELCASDWFGNSTSGWQRITAGRP